MWSDSLNPQQPFEFPILPSVSLCYAVSATLHTSDSMRIEQFPCHAPNLSASPIADPCADTLTSTFTIELCHPAIYQQHSCRNSLTRILLVWGKGHPFTQVHSITVAAFLFLTKTESFLQFLDPQFGLLHCFQGLNALTLGNSDVWSISNPPAKHKPANWHATLLLIAYSALRYHCPPHSEAAKPHMPYRQLL
jgi:hypothetical protein